MMNLVIDARDAQLDRVGVSVYAQNVIPRLINLSEGKYKVTLLTHKEGVLKFDVADYVSVLQVAPSPRASVLKKIIWYYRLPKLLCKLNADVYFGNFTKLPFMDQFYCALVITAHDAASISTNNLVAGKFARALKKYFYKKAVSGATKIICISRYCLEEFSAIFGSEFRRKSSVIYHGLPDEFKNVALDHRCDSNLLRRIRERFNIQKRYILSVGTITPKKNYVRLMNAFDVANNGSVSLVIVGRHSYGSEFILSHKESLTNPAAVHFVGGLDTIEVCSLMKGAEFFVFPSLYEGFGIPLLEAFYLKTPVLCSRSTCLPEIAGNAAEYFDPYDEGELACKIELMLANKNNSKLVLNGTKRLNQFSWDISAVEHLKLLEHAYYEAK